MKTVQPSPLQNFLQSHHSEEMQQQGWIVNFLLRGLSKNLLQSGVFKTRAAKLMSNCTARRLPCGLIFLKPPALHVAPHDKGKYFRMFSSEFHNNQYKRCNLVNVHIIEIAQSLFPALFNEHCSSPSKVSSYFRLKTLVSTPAPAQPNLWNLIQL